MFTQTEENKHWNVFEVKLDGTGLRPMVECSEPDIEFYDGTYLPDGRVIAVSNIGYQGVPCVSGSDVVGNMMLYDPKVAHEFAKRMLEKGVYVVAFSYPVVPKGKARIRTQLTAALDEDAINDYFIAVLKIEEWFSYTTELESCSLFKSSLCSCIHIALC